MDDRKETETLQQLPLDYGWETEPLFSHICRTTT